MWTLRNYKSGGGRAILAGVLLFAQIICWGQQENRLPKPPSTETATSQSHVEHLLQDLDAGDRKVREAAHKELVAIGSPAVRALSAILKDTDNPKDNRREDAAAILGEIGDRKAVPALLEALREDWSEGVRYSAGFALGRIGDPSAVPALSRMLDEIQSVAATRPFKGWLQNRRCFLNALSMTGTPEAVAALQKHLVTDGRVDYDIAFAIGQSQTPQAVDALGKVLKDKSLDGRADAIPPALARTGRPEATQLLVEMLGDSSSSFRQQAAKSLS